MPRQGSSKLTLKALRSACWSLQFELKPQGGTLYTIKNHRGAHIAHYQSRNCKMFIVQFTTINRAKDLSHLFDEIDYYTTYPEGATE